MKFTFSIALLAVSASAIKSALKANDTECNEPLDCLAQTGSQHWAGEDPVYEYGKGPEYDYHNDWYGQLWDASAQYLYDCIRDTLFNM